MNQNEKIKYFIENKKYCYECKYYRSSTFCGYTQSLCTIVGSLDCDQNEYHPDITADTCLFYNRIKQPYAEKVLENMLEAKDDTNCHIIYKTKYYTFYEYDMLKIEEFWEDNKGDKNE